MPFIDLNKEHISNQKDSFDFVIVGSGAAGILLAIKLTEKGKKVLILESGDFEEDELHQGLNKVEQTGKELSNAVWGRKRAIGGTTVAWGGQSLPFSDLDFQHRDWVENSGWPISKTDLTAYYPIANRFMGIDEYDYSNDIFELLKMKPLPFDNQLLSYHFSKWAPEPNFKKLYKQQLNDKVTVVYNAVVTNININSTGKAESVTVKNFEKLEYTIELQQLLLATGTIEANRLLLASNDKFEAGLGNQSGKLGKSFMDHPCIEVGFVNTNNKYRLQSQFNTHMYQNRKYSIRLSLSESVQRKNHLLNASAGIMFDYPEDAFDPYIEIRNYLKTRKVTSLLQGVKNLPAYVVSAKALFFDKLIYKHQARAKVVLMLEQEPLESSYIKLSSNPDAFGMLKAVINWQIGHNTWRTVNETSGYIQKELSRLSLGDLKVHPHINPENNNWEKYLTDVNHHMGGVRMSDTVSTGVVNSNLQVWGHDNIYVCSCAVFPTVSHSNPTLTMMALCLRLVDKLTKQ